MTNPVIEARVEQLRMRARARATRPRKDGVDTLARVLEGWRDPASAWRRDLEAKLPEATGFHPATVREGLDRALVGWTGDALQALVEAELGSDSRVRHTGFDVTALLLAGSIPMPTLLAMLTPLVLGSSLLVRPASRDPVTAGLIARSLAETDPELGACVAEVHFEHDDEDSLEAFLETDCTVAYGSDTTVATLRRRLPPSRRLVPHPHRLSLAVLGDAATRGAALDAASEGLALDTALWDQLGCLSPLAVFVVSEDEAAVDRVAPALADALHRAGERWPRGRVDTDAAAVIAHERDTALLRESAGTGVCVHAPSDGSFTVVRETDLALRAAPLHRFLRVHPVTDAEELSLALSPYARHLAGIAHAGLTNPQLDVLIRSGASRLCAPGTLQCPPLAWHHDGMPVLLPLARTTDLEALAR